MSSVISEKTQTQSISLSIARSTAIRWAVSKPTSIARAPWFARCSSHHRHETKGPFRWEDLFLNIGSGEGRPYDARRTVKRRRARHSIATAVKPGETNAHTPGPQSRDWRSG